MISTKTINNQNAITNAVLGTDDNSNTTINGNLLIQDTNNNSTFITPLSITTYSNSNSTIITPSSITTPSLNSLNSILGSLTVTGISNFINTLNINNTISLTDGTTTNTLNQSNWTGTANVANNIALTSDDTNTTCYIPFSKTTSATSNQLFIDNITSPLSYNPNSGRLISSIFQGRIILPTAQNTATFATSTLTINGTTYTFQNSSINITGTTNTISSLSLFGTNVGGVYNVGIYNGGSGNLTIGVALGLNIRTIYATPITVPTLGYALMEIKVLVINSITIHCVDVNILNI